MSNPASDRKSSEDVASRVARLYQRSLFIVYTRKSGEDFRLTDVSDAVTPRLGYEPRDFVENLDFWANHLHPEDRGRALQHLVSVVEQDHHIEHYRFLCKDGTYCWIRDEALLDHDAEGDPREILGYWLDVTDSAALASRESEQPREARSGGTTQLRLLATASHDLRQPIQALRIMLTTLRMQPAAAERDQVMQEMEAVLEFMSGVLDILSGAESPEESFREAHIVEFPVAGVLQRIEVLFAKQAAEKGLSFRIFESSAFVRSNPALLERILQNLVANAIRYTDQGKILVGARRRGDVLRIEVWDTGIGIPEEETQAIFEEFYRVDRRMREHPEGLGLGLAIVDRAARLLGHKVTVTSAAGKGSVFALEVPRGGPERKRS